MRRAMDWQHLPLIVVTIIFGAFIVWKVRPALLSGGGHASRAELRAAHERIEAAKDDASRALALCDAGDAAAGRVGGRTSALGFYLRAMRTDPASPEIVVRVVKALERRPRALESVLWRHLGAAPWGGANAAGTKAALTALAALYQGPLRNAARGRALEHAVKMMETSAPPS